MDLISTPRPALAVSAAIATLGLSRWISRRAPLAVPTAILGGALLVVAVAGWRGTLLDPEFGPFGYANATATFFVIAAAAALLLHHRSTHNRTRAIAAASVLLGPVVPAAVGSRAGVVGGLLVAAGLIPGVQRHDRSRLARTGWAAVCVVVVLTAALGLAWNASSATTGLPLIDRAAGDRVELWAKAVDLIGQEPVRGVGPGAFGAAAEPASYPFQRYAHSDYLQAGAELGTGGLVLTMGALAWLFRAARNDDSAVGILVLTAVGTHIAVDYVGQFVIVATSAAAIVGASAARSASPSLEEAPR
jgi:O-antigen ligase